MEYSPSKHKRARQFHQQNVSERGRLTSEVTFTSCDERAGRVVPADPGAAALRRFG
jgi:hypothetical protein